MHRLPTIRNADKIAVVDKGKNVEEGTHDTLMAIGEEGRYNKLNNKGGGGATSIKASHSNPENMSVSVAGGGGKQGGKGIEADTELGHKAAADLNSEDKKVADAEKKKLEADKKKKSKGNVSRVRKMHEDDSFFFFVGTVGAILVGAANPSVGIIFVKGIFRFSLTTPTWPLQSSSG